MEEQLETEPHPDYIKGFNEGYILAQHQPELATKIAKALGDSERGKGFQGGQWQCKEEIDKDRYPAWLNRDHTKEAPDEKQKSKGDIEKDKD